MQCTRCGEPLTLEDAFCGNCGLQVLGASTIGDYLAAPTPEHFGDYEQPLTQAMAAPIPAAAWPADGPDQAPPDQAPPDQALDQAPAVVVPMATPALIVAPGAIAGATAAVPLITAASPPPPRSTGKIVTLMALGALAIVLVALAVIFATDDSDEVTSPGSIIPFTTTTLAVGTSVETTTATSAAPTTTAAPSTTAESTTTVAVSTTVAPSTTAVATTVSVTTVPATTVVVVPATTAPATTTPATTAPATTTAPTAAPTTTISPTFGDLGLSKPITRPACDGRYIVFVGASTDPDHYAQQVQEVLTTNSGSNYLRTDLVCTSLRQEFEGNHIYGVYYGPYNSVSAACNKVDDVPTGAYVKILDNVTPESQVVPC